MRTAETLKILYKDLTRSKLFTMSLKVNLINTPLDKSLVLNVTFLIYDKPNFDYARI
jgi:hypothetical protein